MSAGDMSTTLPRMPEMLFPVAAPHPHVCDLGVVDALVAFGRRAGWGTIPGYSPEASGSDRRSDRRGKP
jgi:hypothetical protein